MYPLSQSSWDADRIVVVVVVVVVGSEEQYTRKQKSL